MTVGVCPKYVMISFSFLPYNDVILAALWWQVADKQQRYFRNVFWPNWLLFQMSAFLILLHDNREPLTPLFGSSAFWSRLPAFLRKAAMKR